MIIMNRRVILAGGVVFKRTKLWNLRYCSIMPKAGLAQISKKILKQNLCAFPKGPKA